MGGGGSDPAPPCVAIRLPPMRRVIRCGVFLLAACGPAAPADPEAAALDRLYRSGATFEAFLAAADSMAGQWQTTYAAARPESALVARVRSLDTTWRLLVVAEDWCTDALNTLPYLARLAEQSDGRLELRIVASDAGGDVIAARPTFDRRAATPTVVLLDGNGRPRGCWVERPYPLGLWAREHKPQLSEEDYTARKAAWYAEDAGATTLREIVEMLAGAGSDRQCLGNAR